MKPLKSFLVLFLLCFVFTSPLLAKKKKEERDELKKIVAISQVETGNLSLENMTPAEVSDLFRNRIRKGLEETGRTTVLFVQPEKPAEETPAANETAPQTIEQTQKMLQQMMRAMPTSMGGSGPTFRPVAAQALFTCSISTSKGGVDTGGTFGTAGDITSTSVGLGDFSTESVKLVLTCRRLNPETGVLIDHNEAKASSTHFNRLAGANYSPTDNASDAHLAFDTVFKKTLKQTVEWIDKKMKPLPWEGQIFRKEGDRLFLNAGQTAGIKPAMLFTVFNKEAVTGKGIDLGSQEVASGQVTVTEIKEQYSIVQLTSGAAKVGSVVRKP